MTELNPWEDLAQFAKKSLERHEDMQTATRRDAANLPSQGIKRTYVELATPKGFADQPQKPRKSPDQAQETTTVTTSGAFWRVYEKDGDWMMQGGQVTGGDGTVSVDDFSIGSVASPPADGHILWLQVTGDGILSGGRIRSGFDVSAATTDSGASGSLPDNTLPTSSSHTGKHCYIRLGVWNDDVISQDLAPGGFQISFCAGNTTYIVGRI